VSPATEEKCRNHLSIVLFSYHNCYQKLEGKKTNKNTLPGLVLLNNDAGSRLAQPGVSAIPMRHSLLKRVKENKNFCLEWKGLPNIYSWEKQDALTQPELTILSL